MSDTKKWYVIYVTDERRISFLPSAIKAAATDAAVWEPRETFIQRIHGRGVFSGDVREKIADKPLYPKYVFVHIDLSQAKNLENIVKTTCGGVFLTGAGGKNPIALTDEELEQIRSVERTHAKPKNIVEQSAFYIGQVIEIIAGDFRGTKGVVKQLRRKTIMVDADFEAGVRCVEISPTYCVAVNNEE